jgi:two-component system nitrate/nitrite response regulator NarL
MTPREGASNRPGTSMRVLVIDDEQLVLEGLEAFLQAALPDITLDKTADLPTALRLAAAFHYELVLLDWHLVDEHGGSTDPGQIIASLRQQGGNTPIIVVSGDVQGPWAQRLAQWGLAGMVPKSAPGKVLLAAIDAARPSPHGSAESLTLAHTLPAAPAAAAAPAVSASATELEPRAQYPELTERQAEVFKVMARGLSDKQIARELGIAETTVKTHVRAILDVVGVRRRGAAVWAMQQGTGHHAG